MELGFKRLLTLVLVSVFVAGTTLPSTISADNVAQADKGKGETVAADIANHWAADAMHKWRSEGLLKGDAAGKLNPDAAISRAEFMAFVNRAMGFNEQNVDLSKYRDIKGDEWYAADVAKALTAGYITGTSQNTVDPLMPVSNEQAFLILARLAKAERKIDLSVVQDKEKISSWAKDGVAKAIASGYVTGYEGKIMPDKKTSRAQIVVLLERFRSDERVLAFPGVYEIKEAKKITVLRNGISLRNTTIKGDLILKNGVEKIGINNVNVLGKVFKEVGKDLKTVDIKDVGSTLQDELKDGTYEGIGKGYGGDMKFRVVIKDGKIKDIKILQHNETESYLAKVDGMLKQILEKGGIEGVDTVSGATMTSDAILNAIKDVYSQAAGKTQSPGKSEASGSGHSSGNSGNTISEKTVGEDFENRVFVDGVYKGSAQGFRGRVYVAVTVAGGKVTDIQIERHNEDGVYYERAKRVIEKILEKKSTAVDTISGATVSSKAIIAAVEKALSIEKPAAFADGTWYGQGRGFYLTDKFDNEQNKAEGGIEVKAVIENGDIKDIELIYFGDDDKYKRPDGYKLINKYVKDNKGIKDLMAIYTTQNDKEGIYDAIAGATFSTKGYTAAIEDALNRSAKFKKDSVPQGIRSISPAKKEKTTFTYDEGIDLGEVELIIKYLDESKPDKKVTFAELGQHGISCNYPQKAIIEPEEPNKYSEAREIWIEFKHKDSTARYKYHATVSRKVEKVEIDRIEINSNNKTYTINTNKDNHSYDFDLGDDELSKIDELKVYDADNKTVEVKEYAFFPNKFAILVDLGKIQNPDDAKIIKEYRFSSYVVNFSNNVAFDKNHIKFFNISKVPAKLTYKKGEKLDVSDMTLDVVDVNYKTKTIGLNEFAEYGFTVTPANDTVLDSEGQMFVQVAHTDAEIPSKEFPINVIAATGKPAKVDCYFNVDGVLEKAGTVELVSGIRIYTLEVKKSYLGKTMDAKILTEDDQEVPAKELQPKEKYIKIVFADDTYVMIRFDFKL